MPAAQDGTARVRRGTPNRTSPQHPHALQNGGRVDTNHAVPTIRAHLAPAQPMATPKPANSQLLRITDPTSGAEMHIEGLSEAAARYVA